MPESRPECPRCGYDQSGVIATWEQAESRAWPLSGRCSECGVEFRWVDVFRPEWNRIAWLYEHAPAWWSLGLVWKTWWRALRARSFWRAVPVAAMARPARLLLWALLLAASFQSVIGGLHIALLAWSMHRVARAPIPWLRSDVLSDLLSVGAAPWVQLGNAAAFRWGWGWHGPPYCLTAGLAASLLVPAELLILSSSRADSKVRRAHVFRAGIYGCAWVVPLGVLMAAASLSQLGSFGTPGGGVWRAGYWLAESLGLYGGPPVALVAIVLWIGVWWHAAIVTGFRFERGRTVWALLMVGVLLLSLSIALYDWNFTMWTVKWLI